MRHFPNSAIFKSNNPQFLLSFLSYRKGVLVGDYVEDLASKADINSRELSKSFTGTSTAKLDYNAVGKTGAELLAASTRDDIRLKYGKYGKTESLGNGFGGCFATMSQLAYTSPVSTHNQEGAPEAHQPLKTSDFIWTGSNIGDSKVPRTVLANRLAEERRQRLEEESSRNLFASTEKVR